MDKANIILIRDRNKAVADSVSFIGDNMKIYNENRDTVIWDDDNTNGLVNVIRTNDNYKTSVEKPVVLETFQYSEIQYISSTMNIAKLKIMLDNFVTDELLTEERRTAIIQYFNSIVAGTYNPSPGTNA